MRWKRSHFTSTRNAYFTDGMNACVSNLLRYRHHIPLPEKKRTINDENGRIYSWIEFSVQLICDSHIFKFLLYVKNRRIRKGEEFIVDQKTLSL
jgi:hypothetical protein